MIIYLYDYICMTRYIYIYAHVTYCSVCCWCVSSIFGGIRIILPSSAQRVDLTHVSYLIIKYHQIPRTIFIADKITCSCSCHAQSGSFFYRL